MGFGINKFKCPSCCTEFNSAWCSVTMDFGTNKCPNCGTVANYVGVLDSKAPEKVIKEKYIVSIIFIIWVIILIWYKFWW